MYDWATNVLPHHPIVMLGKECRMTRTQSKWFVPHPMLPWGCLNEKCPTAPVIRVYLMCKLLWGQLIATFCLLIVCQSACYSKAILEVGFYHLCPGCHWLQMEIKDRGGVVLFRRTATEKMWQLIISVKLVSRYLRKAWLGLARNISSLIIVCCNGTRPVPRNCDWKICQWLTIDHLVPTGFKLIEKSCLFEARPQSFHFFPSLLIVTTSASGNNRNSLLAQEESSKSRWGVTKSRIPGVMHCSAWRVRPSLAEKKTQKGGEYGHL